MTRLHERCGIITAVTGDGRQTVTFTEPTRCCGDPQCVEINPPAMKTLMFGVYARPSVLASVGTEVVTYWRRGATGAGLGGEVVLPTAS